MDSKLYKISWYEGRETHEAVVGSPQSAFSLFWVLDAAEGVTQWTTDIPEGEFSWAKQSNWRKWRNWGEWIY
jgi:hypothetical protein